MPRVIQETIAGAAILSTSAFANSLSASHYLPMLPQEQVCSSVDVEIGDYAMDLRAELA
jgi:hypothetical protein